MGQYGYLDDLKTIEHSTLKVPYEILNKQYRNVQKSIDRDSSAFSQTFSNAEKLCKGVNGNEVTKSEMINSLISIIDKLKSVKKHSLELRNEEKDLFKLIKKRVEHLKDHEAENQIVLKNFKKLRLDRLLIDYFLRSGFYETADQLAKKNDIQVF